MRIRALAIAIFLSCSHEPPGQCLSEGDCGPGTQCQSTVCVACPDGLCPVTAAIPAAGESVTVLTTPFSSNTNVSVRFPQDAVPGGTQITLTAPQCSALPPAPLGGGCVTAFNVAAPGVARFAHPLTLRGATTVRPGTEMMIARLAGSEWVDTVTAIVGRASFKSLHPTTTLPGILEPGTYLVYTAGPGVIFPPADFGVALIPDDGNGKSGLQVITLLDDDGFVLPNPTLSTLPSLGGDLDGAALTPDGSQGVMVDGGNFIVFFSGVGTGQLAAAAGKIDVTPYGGDGDAIAIMPDGNEAVVSADGDSLVVISGIAAGLPVLAVSVPIPDVEDGLVISNDGRVLLARGFSGMSVFSIDPIKPQAGPLGGALAHNYTHVVDWGSTLSRPYGEDGRDGLAVSPANSSNAVVVGAAPSPLVGPGIQLITGLPGTSASPPVLHDAVSITGADPLSTVGAGSAWAVSITPDGTRAIVGTAAGLVMFTGVDTGTLVQAGPPYDVTFLNGASYALSKAGVPTLGITLDGDYVVALTPSPDYSNGTLLMIPLTASGFGAPVTQLNGVAVPSNDQILLH
ncbi:MAG: hypothetical protein ACXWLM_08340 [Myxococcales bacterium]